MSDQPIRILIVDENEKTRDTLIEQLRFEDVTVIGESSFGAAAYTWAQQLDVDVVLVSIEEPIARSLRTVESLSVGARAWPVLGISSLTDRETMRKAVVAGVRDYLVSSVKSEELHQAILNVHRVEQSRRSALEQGQTAGRAGTIIVVCGAKGGIGKSTVAVNLAVTLAEQTKQQIALVDLDLQFGDAAVMLDIVPERTIEQAATELVNRDPQLMQGFLTDHASRLRLLAAPATPEGAETVSEEQTTEILMTLAAINDYVVVDTSAQLDSLSIQAMDLATMVLLIVVPEVTSVRRTRAVLSLMEDWGYSRDKVKLIVNRADKKSEVSNAEIEKVLKCPVYAQIPDDRAVVKGISLGTPVVISAPKSRAGRAFNDLGRVLVGMPKSTQRGLFRRRKHTQMTSGGRRTPRNKVIPAVAPGSNGSPPVSLATDGPAADGENLRRAS